MSDDDRHRRELSTSLERAAPSRDPDLDEVVRRASALRARRSLGFALAAVLAVAGVVLPLWRLSPLGEGTQLRPGTTPTGQDLDPRVTATIPVGPFPSSIAIGHGAVWVSVGVGEPSPARPEDYVARIDPKTNEVVATIPLAAPLDIAVSPDGVWVTDHSPALGSIITRIDPATNRVVATIPLGKDVTAGDLVATEAGVWVTVENSIVRIDPRSNQVVATIPVGPAGAQEPHSSSIASLAVGEGALWAFFREFVVEGTDVRQVGSTLQRLDMDADRVTDTFTLPRSSLAFAVGEGSVWVSHLVSSPGEGGTAQAALRIDPQSGEQVGELILMEKQFLPFDAGLDGVWFVDGPGIARLNSETLVVDEAVVTPSSPADADLALDVETAAVWVAHESVIRIDLR